MPMQANNAGDDVDAQDRELDLVDTLKVLLSGWPFILASLVISLGAGWLYLSDEKPQFQVEIVMTTGRVPTLVAAAPVESQNDTLAHLRSPRFVAQLSETLDWAGDDRERLLQNSLNIRTFGQDAVQVSFRTHGEEDAMAAIAAVEQVMGEQFEAIAAPIAAQTQAALQVVDTRIQESEALLANIVAAYEQTAPDDAATRADLLKLQRDVMGDLVFLRLQRSGLQASLGSDLVGPPALVEEPFVSQQPVHPVRNRVLAVAGFMGLSFGVLCCALWALARHMRGPARRKASVA